MSGTAKEVHSSKWRSPGGSPARAPLTSLSTTQVARAADSPASSAGSGKPNRIAATQSKQNPTATETKTRVLVVEDDSTSANALRAILTRRGCDVLVASDMAGGLA